MIADPCGDIVQPGQYLAIEGSIARSHKSIECSNTSTGASGYIFWCPDYCPSVENLLPSPTAHEANLFAFSSNSASTNPTNTPASPYGNEAPANFFTGSNMVTSCMLSDPSAFLATSSLVADVRCLSACMRVTPTGKMLDMSGQLAFIEGIPLEALMGIPHDGLASSTPASVNSLFDYASDTRYLGRDACEIKWRPHDTSAIFRSAEDGAVHVGGSSGAANQSSRPSESAETQSPLFFGLCWRGVDVTVGHPFIFDLIKNNEFRLKPISHLSHMPARQVSDTPLVDDAVRVLDRRLPSWQTTHREQFASTLMKIALGEDLENAAVDMGVKAVKGLWNGAFGPPAPELHELGGGARP
jgi:hypothetical protein